MENGVTAKYRRQIGRIAAVLAVSAALIVTVAGLWIRHLRAVRDPVHLIKYGTAFERLQATADLGVLDEGRDVDRVMAALVVAIDDGEIVLRSAAEESLGSLVAQVLIRSGANTPDAQVQTVRRLSLAIRKLSRGLSDPEPTIRASAAIGLGQLASTTEVDLPPELVAALHDESPQVRNVVVKALSSAQLTASVVPALITELASPDKEVQLRATEILAHVGPAAMPAMPALLAMLSEPFDLKRSQTDRTLPNYWDPACAAAVALGKIGAAPESIAGLTAMLASDVPARVHTAASALAMLGPPAACAVPALIIAYDKFLRAEGHMIGQSAVVMALGELGPLSPAGPEALKILTRGLDSKDKWIRVSAAEALGQFGRDATPALSKLRELEQSPVRELHDAAAKSVAAIEAEFAAHSGAVSHGPER